MRDRVRFMVDVIRLDSIAFNFHDEQLKNIAANPSQLEAVPASTARSSLGAMILEIKFLALKLDF